MSYFGDGSLAQDILDEVEYQQEQHNVTSYAIISALAEIIQYYAQYK